VTQRPMDCKHASKRGGGGTPGTVVLLPLAADAVPASCTGKADADRRNRSEKSLSNVDSPIPDIVLWTLSRCPANAVTDIEGTAAAVMFDTGIELYLSFVWQMLERGLVRAKWSIGAAGSCYQWIRQISWIYSYFVAQLSIGSIHT
jgi:hypothetical protein